MLARDSAHGVNRSLQDELRDMTRSAVLWQQVRALSAGLRSGKISTAQFVSNEPARPGIVAFLEAVQWQVDTQRLPQKADWVKLKRDGGDEGESDSKGDGGGGGDDKMEEG